MNWVGGRAPDSTDRTDRWLFDAFRQKLSPEAFEAFQKTLNEAKVEEARAARVIKDFEDIRYLREAIHEARDVKRALTQYYAARKK